MLKPSRPPASERTNIIGYDLLLIARSLEILERSRRLLDETRPTRPATVPPLNGGPDQTAELVRDDAVALARGGL